MAKTVRTLHSLQVKDAYIFDGGKATPYIEGSFYMSQYHLKEKILSYGAIARISAALMEKLGVSLGDVIEIKGEEKTVARCLPLYPSDDQKRIIRVDQIIRSNIDTNIGGSVSIRKVTTEEALKVVLGKFPDRLSANAYDFQSVLSSVPLIKGKIITTQHYDKQFRIKIKHVVPDGVVMVHHTHIEIDDGFKYRNFRRRHIQHIVRH